MEADKMQAIAETLMRVVTSEMSPKQLIKAIKVQYPTASKKDIARAAFFSLIANADIEASSFRNLRADRRQRLDVLGSDAAARSTLDQF